MTGQLRKARKEKGLTLKEVAKVIGVHEATVSRWESGNIENIKKKNLLMLCKFLEISPQTLIMDNLTEKERENIMRKNIRNFPRKSFRKN